MSFLLDTNIVSQPTRPIPDANVIAWLNGIDQKKAFLSVVTIQEIRGGIELMPDGKRKRAFDDWLVKQLIPRFQGNILPYDLAVADRCGRILAAARKAGQNPELSDVVIAATALVNGLDLVTLNRKHFPIFGVTMFTP